MAKSRITVPNEPLLREVSELLRSGLPVTMPVKGSSMLPFIKGGRDRVVIAPFTNLGKGDIVLAKTRSKSYVIHRITKIRGSEVTLMGDGNLYDTEVCSTADVIGRVTSIIIGQRITRCNSLRFKSLSLIWIILLPLRRYLLRICKSRS